MSAAPEGMIGNAHAIAESRRRGWGESLAAVADAAKLIGVEPWVAADPTSVAALEIELGIRKRAWGESRAAPAPAPAAEPPSSAVAGNTSSTASAPQPAPMHQRAARDMSPAELASFERQNGINPNYRTPRHGQRI